ncbi:hypothetical protein MATL_G00237120 [Megalops atlanticus]|uniref:Plasmalemma vesicle associated protein a n=1 Tax=Megalops atlanticus TaxID=7932 RepID=A0A9D3T1A7_MEGAT|nr:hypothetical protein MATL_G00237120 [Megalops atlanticus]
MYNSGYSQAKFGMDARKIHRSKSKSCGYYMRIIFFFSSLIQSLIIVSLVLFMVYGRPAQSSEEKRVQDLGQSFETVNMENKMLRQTTSNLTQLLNQTVTKLLADAKDLKRLRELANISASTIVSLNIKLATCEREKNTLTRPPTLPLPLPHPQVPTSDIFSWQSRKQQLETMLKLVETNFTQTVRRLSWDLDRAVRDRDDLRLNVIGLRRNASALEQQLEMYGRKCKDDFVKSLEGIQSVTKAFLTRIDGLFPSVFPFQLTCDKQKEQLDQMRANCSSLSREVENKFQAYLNVVGDRVTQIQGDSSQLKVQNQLLQEDMQWCTQNRTATAAEAARRLREVQRKNDEEVERLLREQKKLREDRELKEQMLSVRNSQIAMLNTNIQSLNSSLAQCLSRQTPGKFPMPFPGGTSNMQNPFFRPGSTSVAGAGGVRPGSSVLGINTPGGVKPGLSVTGHNLPNLPNLPNILGFNKPGTGAVNPDPVMTHVKELQEMANKGSGVSG